MQLQERKLNVPSFVGGIVASLLLGLAAGSGYWLNNTKESHYHPPLYEVPPDVREAMMNVLAKECSGSKFMTIDVFGKDRFSLACAIEDPKKKGKPK